jgi:para-aminobenzoate synthetase component 1
VSKSPSILQALLPANIHEDSIFVLASHHADGKHLIAIGKEDEFVLDTSSDDGLKGFQNWLDKNQDWKFGYISYDVKNCIEALETKQPNRAGLPLIHFLQPRWVIRYEMDTKNAHVLKGEESILKEIAFEKLFAAFNGNSEERQSLQLKPRMDRDQYLHAIHQLQQHIHEGDIYEVNYCQEFYAAQSLHDPWAVWQRLNTFTEAPFSSYVQLGEHYLLSASPERYLKREGDRIISQPIKGTIKRGKTELEEEELKQALLHSEKERSENVMIVDLVRNDLSKSAKRGSVKVDELFGVYTFKTVHHLISTVSGELKEGTTFTQLLRDTFPMGSMTGAPKFRAMQLIDQYEYARRGLYSGSVGYITPNGDFDFNVVIRSIVYNANKPYISCSVGSAITALSVPEKEYEECLLKAEAIMKTLES